MIYKSTFSVKVQIVSTRWETVFTSDVRLQPAEKNDKSNGLTYSGELYTGRTVHVLWRHTDPQKIGRRIGSHIEAVEELKRSRRKKKKFYRSMFDDARSSTTVICHRRSRRPVYAEWSSCRAETSTCLPFSLSTSIITVSSSSTGHNRVHISAVLASTSTSRFFSVPTVFLLGGEM